VGLEKAENSGQTKAMTNSVVTQQHETFLHFRILVFTFVNDNSNENMEDLLAVTKRVNILGLCSLTAAL